MDAAAIIIPVVIVVVLVVLFLLYVLVNYNSLKALRARVDEAWSDIEAQMGHRAELVPQLVETVQGHASHEKALLRSVTDARAETLQATSPGQATVAETHMQQALRSMYSTAEGYPALNAGPQFLQLQGDISETAEKIQASRRFYNGGVREFNAKRKVFPGTLFAKRPGFEEREFFEVADASAKAEPPRIQF